MTVLRAKSGQRSTNVALNELIYPTDYEPGEIPRIIHTHGEEVKTDEGKKKLEGVKRGEGSKNVVDANILAKLKTTSLAKAFQLRNLGLVLRVQPEINVEDATCQLNVAADFTSYEVVPFHLQEGEMTTMPKFESKRIQTTVTCRFNEPFMLKTISRSPFANKSKGLTERGWFAMMTVKPVKQ